MELVIMAAGLGSRFGGLKQLQPVDENGNFLIDYSVFDAKRCGFDKIVFVIREANYKLFDETIGQRIKDKIDVSYVFQEHDNLNINREKPLGTGFAVLLTENEIDKKFGVINADDFYGYESFKVLADFLKNNESKKDYCIVSFKLKNTLSKFGKVNRGACVVENGLLKKIDECSISNENGNQYIQKLTDGTFIDYDENMPVSMNMFGFDKSFFEFLENDFEKFASNDENLKSKEFYLPVVVANAINSKKINVNVLKTNSKWIGMTYRQDIDEVKEKIKKLKEDGIYPENLWDESNFKKNSQQENDFENSLER